MKDKTHALSIKSKCLSTELTEIRRRATRCRRQARHLEAQVRAGYPLHRSIRLKHGPNALTPEQLAQRVLAGTRIEGSKPFTADQIKKMREKARLLRDTMWNYRSHAGSYAAAEVCRQRGISTSQNPTTPASMARSVGIAIAFCRGRSYTQIEKPRHNNPPDWKQIEKLLRKFGPCRDPREHTQEWNARNGEFWSRWKTFRAHSDTYFREAREGRHVRLAAK